MNKPTTAASNNYSAEFQKVQQNLEKLMAALTNDSDCQAEDPSNWGYVGSMGEVNKHLILALQALGQS